MSQPKRNRKGPKRKQPRETKLDNDLVDLITLLDEHRGETSVKGWLSVPWRDGWHAARLALDIAAECGTEEFKRVKDTWEHLKEILRDDVRTLAVYARLDEILHTIRWSHATPALRAAARIMQVVIAKSDGGGEVENAILEPIISGLDEPWMLYHRMCDALGIRSATMLTPTLARRKKAFETAWKRGLFRVAYALPQLPQG